MKMSVNDLARRYRLGETLEFPGDKEYALDVTDMIEKMLGKPRAYGRGEEELASDLKGSRALEHCLRYNVPDLVIPPWGENENWSYDLRDEETGAKIEVKTQFWGSVTWKPKPKHLQNLLNTYAAGEVTHVLTGAGGWGDTGFRAVYYQLIPVELIFKGRPDEFGLDPWKWINWRYFMKIPEKPERVMFKNDVATDEGLSARVLKSYQGKFYEKEDEDA